MTENDPSSLIEETHTSKNNLEPQMKSSSTLSLFTTPPEKIISKGDVNFSDPLFPFSPEFASKSRKDKEQLFLHKFEEQLLAIRNKELKCGPTPVESLLTQERLDEIANSRSQFFEKIQNNESRKAITQTETEESKIPPPRVDVATNPTFDTLLNVNYESQFSLLRSFQNVLSTTIIQNRVNKRINMLAQFLLSNNSNAVENLHVSIKDTLTPQCLLTPPVHSIDRILPKFSQPEKNEVPIPPEPSILSHHIEKSFNLYTPGLVERFQLTTFPRTDNTTFVFMPIDPPSKFPTVAEEQPIREKTIEQLANVDVKEVKSDQPIYLPKVIQYPRETRFYPFDPTYSLRPQPYSLPDLPDEIGRSCILALPLSEYTKMSIAGKGRFYFAPQEFSGVPHINDSGLFSLKQITQPNSDDLRELEADDDIDNINVKPKVRPITDFLTKKLSSKNKANQIMEIIIDGQDKWKERETTETRNLLETMDQTNQLLNDTSLKLPDSDLQEFVKH